MNNHFILTNCTGRKRVGIQPLSFDPPATSASLQEVSKAWLTQVESTKTRCKAADLYLGRTVIEAMKSKSALEARLYFISAGLGLVAEDAEIPKYDLSVAQKSGTLSRTLARFQKTPTTWWNLLNEGRFPIAEMVRANATTTIWIALPASYLDLVCEDLNQLSENDLWRIRIFTSSAGREYLAPIFREACLSYDERLNSMSEFAGTRNDFPQRAMWHYISKLGGGSISLDDGQIKVQQVMTGCRLSTLPKRSRVSDKEIVEIISRNWAKTNGSSARLLRLIRDELLVSCEQKRFARLWSGIKNSKVGERYAA